MTAHRQHYFEANRERVDKSERFDSRPAFWQTEPAHQPDIGSLIVFGLVLLFLAIVGVSALVKHNLTPPKPTPMRAQSALVTPLPAAQALEDARIEGFRAGAASAVANGCRHPVMDTPIGHR